MLGLTKSLAFAVVSSILLAGAASAIHDPDISDAELKCQKATNKAGGKYAKNALKCAVKCQQGFFGGANPVTDCYAPYAGATASCVNDPAKSAGATLEATIAKVCDPATKPTSECPACYDAAAGGDGCGLTGYAGAHHQDRYNQIADVGRSVFCRTSGAIPVDQKCQQNAAKVIAKLIGTLGKCYAKCFARAHAGSGTSAGCTPTSLLPSDPTTAGCIGAAQSRAAMSIDQRCTGSGSFVLCPRFCAVDADCDTSPGAGNGDCTNANCDAGYTSTTPYPDGATFVNLVTALVAANVDDSGLGPGTGPYCGS